MGFIKCFDVVSEVVKEACKQFSPLWCLEEENYEILKDYCGAIDILSSENNGTMYEVEIDDIKMTVKISLGCGSMVVPNKKGLFTGLAKRAIEVAFEPIDSESLKITFEFPSLWRRADVSSLKMNLRKGE